MPTILSPVQVPTLATSMMASLYGAARTWDDPITLTDLYGCSGHAFILNIERTLCPSGPTAWDWGAIFFPLRQLFSLRRVCARCDMRDIAEARELIWQRTVESIDAGRPAILWDALLPEFYLVYGYDAERGEYLLDGPQAQQAEHRVSWSSVGGHTGQVWALFPSPHESPGLAGARDLALRGAVNWHRWTNERDAQWVFGGDAWNVWIAAITDEDIVHASHAVSYNHFVYAECRRYAADFLAAQGAEYAEAAQAFATVAAELALLCEAWPSNAPTPPASTRLELANHLAQARDAEHTGIRALEAVLATGKLAARR